jgi:hypothetical protein
MYHVFRKFVGPLYFLEYINLQRIERHEPKTVWHPLWRRRQRDTRFSLNIMFAQISLFTAVFLHLQRLFSTFNPVKRPLELSRKWLLLYLNPSYSLSFLCLFCTFICFSSFPTHFFIFFTLFLPSYPSLHSLVFVSNPCHMSASPVLVTFYYHWISHFTSLFTSHSLFRISNYYL